MGAEEKPPSTGCGDELSDNSSSKHGQAGEDEPSQRDQVVQQPAKAKQELVFRQKQFVIREPLLEKYFDVGSGEHVALFNCFVAIFILATMATWTQDYQQHGNPLHHFWLIAWNFRQLPQTMLVWSAMFVATLLGPFFGLRLWVPHFGASRLAPTIPIVAYLVYQLVFLYCSIWAIFWLDLQGACSFIITCENTRIAMKAHSFFRENLFRRRSNSKAENARDEHQQQQAVQQDDWPSLSHFVLFMFWPTFLYRDSYPRRFHAPAHRRHPDICVLL